MGFSSLIYCVMIGGVGCLEIMYLQDLNPGVSSAIQLIQKGSISAIGQLANVSIGLSTFVDKPVARSSDGKHARDPLTYCYKLRYPITSDHEILKDEISEVMLPRNFGSGGSCHLTALAEASQERLNHLKEEKKKDVGQKKKNEGKKRLLGETPPSENVRVVLMVTDRPYYSPSSMFDDDFVGGRSYAPTDPPASEVNPEFLANMTRYLNEVDHPTISQVRALLALNQVTPLFVVKKRLLGHYLQLTRQLKAGHVTVVKDDYSDLEQAMLNAVYKFVRIERELDCTFDGKCAADGRDDAVKIAVQIPGVVDLDIELPERDDAGLLAPEEDERSRFLVLSE